MIFSVCNEIIYDQICISLDAPIALKRIECVLSTNVEDGVILVEGSWIFTVEKKTRQIKSDSRLLTSNFPSERSFVDYFK